MGILIFLIIALPSLWWLFQFYRSMLGESMVGLRRNIVLMPPNPSGATPLPVKEPIVRPVEEEKLPPKLERLPQIDPSVFNVSPPPPPPPRDVEVLPNFKPNKAKTEESLLYRVLVQALFIVSAISADLAQGSSYSLVAITFTTVGASWSCYRRHHAQTWLNKMVAIASLALGFVLIRNLVMQRPIVGGLWLAIMAVGIQMGLSFNLYDRKTLGYCLLSSAVLMAVAANSSQNPLFTILLAGFVAIAIPTLTLDYRSRLGCQPIGIVPNAPDRHLSSRNLPWQHLAKLAGIALGAGMLLSLLLPNLRPTQLSLPPHNLNIPGLDRSSISQHFNSRSNPAASAPPTAPPPPANPRELASKVFAQAGNNYPADIKSENLNLPPQASSELQQFTQKVLATSPQPLNSDFERAAYLAEYLKQHYQADPNASNAKPLDANSLRQAIANCQAAPQTCQLKVNKQDIPAIHAAMVRSIGIPARIKTGEQLAQIDPQTQLYPRATEQQPSQTQVYVPSWGWFDMDAAPDRPLLATNSSQTEQLQQQLQDINAHQPTPSPSPTPSTANTPNPNNDPNDPRPPTAKDSPPENRSNPSQPSSPPNLPELPKLPDLPKLPKLPDLSADPVVLRTIFLGLLLSGGAFWFWRTYKIEQQKIAQLPPIERIYRSMLVAISKNNGAKLASQTQLEYARSIAGAEHPQIAKVVTEISELYTAWKYGKKRIDPNVLAKKLQYLQHLQQLAAQRQKQQKAANLNTKLDRRS